MTLLKKSVPFASLMLFMVGLVILPANPTQAQKTTGQFKVYGNCEMCKNRIEQAAFSVKGVRWAEWDPETGILSITYKADKTSEEAIHRAITEAGHDTERMQAADDTYEKLHYCCQYPREADVPETWTPHNEHSHPDKD